VSSVTQRCWFLVNMHYLIQKQAQASVIVKHIKMSSADAVKSYKIKEA